MLVKASRRKEEEQKETVFQIGGRTWTTDRVQQTLKRTRGDMGIERSKVRLFVIKSLS